MTKVAFFDTWSRGTKFTDNVALELKIKGIDTVFLHFDSKYNDQCTEANECYSAVYDLSSFGQSVTKALLSIQPDVIVLISMHGLTHRWVNYIAEILEIPVVFLPHGVRLAEVETNRQKLSKLLWVKKSLSRGSFYLSEWFLVFIDLLKSRYSIPCVVLKSFFEFFVDNSRFSNRPRYKWGLNFRVIFLNIEEDRGYFADFIGGLSSRKTKYIVCGHQESLNALGGLKINNNTDNALFISQPMVSWGVIGSDEWLKILNKVITLLKHRFSSVSVRLHPRDDASNIKLYESLGLRISKRDLSEDILGNSFFFGFNSALLIGLMQAGATTVSIESDSLPKFPEVKNMLNFVQVNIDDLDNFLISEFFYFGRESFSIKKNHNNLIINGILEQALRS